LRYKQVKIVTYPSGNTNFRKAYYDLAPYQKMIQKWSVTVTR